MRDNQKTKDELLQEVETLRKHVAKLTQTEKVLRESGGKWRSLLNNTPDIVMIVDCDGTIRFINHTVSGITVQETIGKKVYDFISSEHHEKMRKDLERIFLTGQGASHEVSGVGHQGALSWYQAEIGPIRQDGRIVAASIVTRDITENKRAGDVLKKSEQRFRSLVEVTSDWVWEVDKNGIYTYASPKVKDLLGYEPEEIIGKTPFDLMPPDEAERVGAIFRDIMISRKPFERLENRNLHKDGRLIVLETNSVPIFDASGGFTGYRGIDRDITERKKAEEEIIKFKEMADRATYGCAMSDLKGNLTYINDSFAKMHGYAPVELIGKNLKIFHTEEQIKHVSQLNKRLMETGEGIRGEEVWHVRRDGTEFPTLMSNWILKDSNGNPQLMCATSVDITEHKRAEDELRESEKRYRLLVENQTDMVVKFDPDGVLLFVSPSYCKTFGKSQDDLIGNRFIPLIHEQDRERVAELLNNVYKPPNTAYVEERALTKDGWRWQAWLNTAVLNNEKKVEAVIGVGRDITERKRAEDALRESEKRFRDIFENIAVGVYRTTPDGQILMANPALVHMLGYSSFEELSKRNLEEEGFEPQYKRSMFKEKIEREGRIVSSESIWTTQDGKRLYVIENARAVRDKDGKTLYYEGTVENITKSKQAEEELDMFREKMANAERLASVGTLSAIMAHTLNNPLTAIQLSIQNAMAESKKTPRQSTITKYLKEGLRSVSDVSSTVGGLGKFAAESSKEIISEVNLKAVAERTVKLLSESARRTKMSLHLEGMGKLPPLYSNERDLEQLFFSLVENAIQAADGKKSHQLIISGAVKDKHIELRFTDDCCGIAPENLDKIFELFFTTNLPGEGTGLGLCIVERIVSGAGGKIRFESKVGKGSTFFVTLPTSRGRRY